MSVKVSKEVDDFICVVIIDLIRVTFVATLVVFALRYSIAVLLFFEFIFKLSDLLSHYVIKGIHFLVNSEVIESDT